MHAIRRDVLKAGGITALGAAGTLALPWATNVGAREASLLDERRLPPPFRPGFGRPPVLRPWKAERDADGMLVDHFSVTQRVGRAQIVPALSTPVWGYNGLAPGPTIPVHRGRRVVMRVRNHLPARHPLLEHEFTTSLHLHGSGSLPEYDGYADDVTPPGFYKDDQFPNWQPARTLWHHDHGVHHTAPNVYTGLYAQYQMHDEAERALLPQGEFDVALVVGDAMFGTDGSLAYNDESEAGLWGDVILVNRKAWPVMKVRRRVYRFRILNAAISRCFRFTLDNGDPVTMVCTDGGLMPRSREVMAFDVTDAPVDRGDPTWNRLPNTLANSHVMRLREEQATKTRRLEFHHSNSLWMINGRTWADVIDSYDQDLVADPALNGIEIWELFNPHGGWFHPVHIHLIDFKILNRNGRPPFDYEQGPKDVAYLGENKTVRVLIQFAPHRGRYMVHCHNLVHEDHDVMVQFAVGWKPGDPDDHHPVLADPCKVDNLPEVDAALPGRSARSRRASPGDTGMGRPDRRWPRDHRLPHPRPCARPTSRRRHRSRAPACGPRSRPRSDVPAHRHRDQRKGDGRCVSSRRAGHRSTRSPGPQGRAPHATAWRSGRGTPDEGKGLVRRAGAQRLGPPSEAAPPGWPPGGGTGVVPPTGTAGHRRTAPSAEARCLRSSPVFSRTARCQRQPPRPGRGLA